MTSFIANQVGGVVTPLVAKDKGDISNRAKCSGEQLVNTAQMAVGDVVVLGGTAAVAKSARNGGKFAKIFEKFANFVGNKPKGIYNPMKAIKATNDGIAKSTNEGIAKLGKQEVRQMIARIKLSKLGKKILNAPGYVKATAVALGFAIPTLGYIHGRHLYRQGQIDQKYTDRAKVENHSKNVLD